MSEKGASGQGSSQGGSQTGSQNGSQSEEILGPDDRFHFTCHGGLECFTHCCRDVTIFLTPYDVLRMRRHLQMGSREFLDKYTLISQAHVIPLVLLKMDEENDKRCQLVTEQGCTIYEDRPWACRMFPLDLGEEGGYRLAAGPERCKGIGQGEERRVRHYLEEQGTKPYEVAEKAYLAVTRDPRVADLDVENPAIFKMIFMATYNLDAFREFVFESTFLQRFSLPVERVDKIRIDDEALLEFGYDWLDFGLFGRMNFQVGEQAAQEVERKVAEGKIPGIKAKPPEQDSSGSPTDESDPRTGN